MMEVVVRWLERGGGGGSSTSNSIGCCPTSLLVACSCVLGRKADSCLADGFRLTLWWWATLRTCNR